MNANSRKQPLYDQLVDLLREKIENEWAPGDLLPSERNLCLTYGLSRTTVRLALAELERQGLVTRQHGRGTFVADTVQEATNLLHTYSFTEQMEEMGRVPKTRILEFDKREAPRHVAERLEIHLGDPIFRMKRLRIADDIPVMLEHTYVPATAFPNLSCEAVDHYGLYNIAEKVYHQTIAVAHEEFSASIAGMDDANLLNISEGAPILKLYRTTYNDKNEIIEYTRSVARADQFKYKISHYRT